MQDGDINMALEQDVFLGNAAGCLPSLGHPTLEAGAARLKLPTSVHELCEHDLSVSGRSVSPALVVNDH